MKDIDVQEIIIHEAKGAQIRSGANWIEQKEIQAPNVIWKRDLIVLQKYLKYYMNMSNVNEYIR